MELGQIVFTTILFVCLFKGYLYLVKRLDWYDKCNSRKLQKKPVPNSGGVVIASAVMVFLLIAELQLDWLLIVSIFAVCMVGLIDDRIDLSPKLKFIAQIMVGLCLWIGGFKVNLLSLAFDVHLSSLFNALESIFIFVAVVNAINLFDGINGLCAGLILMVVWGKLIMGIDPGLSSVYWITSIGLIVFLYFNLRNKMYLGDAGSLFLGLIGFISLTGDYSQSEIALGVGFVFGVLVIPLGDTVRVVLIRLLERKSPFQADRNHLHHLVLGFTKSHLLTSTMLLFAALAFGLVSAYLVNRMGFLNCTVLLSLMFVALCLILLSGHHLRQHVLHKRIFSENISKIDYSNVLLKSVTNGRF
jgi:UDP-GlcNAc:undecaprenyl-phosphate GlcNAc-1-phosphate transferase